MTSGALLAGAVALWLIGQWSANRRADERHEEDPQVSKDS